ncbi:MAG: hypothetical protein ACTSQJ_05465 [Promethearchaeota archaeon]
MNFAEYIIIGLTIGIIAYSLYYLGSGFQKYAIEGFKKEKSIKNKNVRVWILGTIFIISYFFIQRIAILYASSNIIAMLESFGLIILLFFSYSVLEEKHSQTQLIGVFLIIVGISFTTFFNTNINIIQHKNLNLQLIFIIFTAILWLEILAIILSIKKVSKLTGSIIGLTAGTFMAFQTFFYRFIGISSDYLIVLFYFFITFLCGLFAILFTQYAFVKEQANVVIPCATSVKIFLSILLGMILLNEKISFLQLYGISLIFCGLLILIISIEEKKSNIINGET